MDKRISRTLLCVLCALLLCSFSVLTPVAEALTATMTLSLAVTALAVLIISSIGVTITAPAGQDVTDYVGSRFQSWVSGQGFSDVGSWFSSTTGIGVASYIAHVFSGVLAVGKLAYDAIKSFVDYFVQSEGIVSGGQPVGELPVSVTPSYSHVYSSRISFADDTLSLSGGSSNDYYIIDGCLGGVFIPLSGWLSSGDTLQVTIPDGSYLFVSSRSASTTPATYYKSSVGYYIAQFVDSTNLRAGYNFSSSRTIYAGTSLHGVTQSSDNRSYTYNGNTYYNAYYSSASTLSSGVRTRTSGTYTITVPSNAKYLFMGLGSGNWLSGVALNGVAVSSSTSIVLSRSASSPAGAVFAPDTNIAQLPALADDQSYQLGSDVITGSMSTTAALAAVTNLASTAEGIQVTSAVADEPVNPPSTGPVTGLEDVFPFCLPFDFVRFVEILSATRAAPVIDWIIPIPAATGLDIGDQYIHLDLSVFDPVAEVLRTAELLASAIGLILLTRELMKW